jgi:hypothetical protein
LAEADAMAAVVEAVEADVAQAKAAAEVVKVKAPRHHPLGSTAVGGLAGRAGRCVASKRRGW